jgi:hypothetical protein
MQIQPEDLKFGKVEFDDDCYGTGPGYGYVASIPGFDLEYRIEYDNSAAYKEMSAVADESGVVHMDDWNRILKKHGDPSESDSKWAVVLVAGDEKITEVVSDLCVFNARAAAQIDFRYRINTAAGVYVQEPDFELMFNPLKVLEEEGV